MNDAQSKENNEFLERLKRLAIVLAGIVICQFILYGPSLIGKKILLPVDNLALPDMYDPTLPEGQQIHQQDRFCTDPIVQFEPDRLFAIQQIRLGHWPLWMPYEYGGSPFIWPKYSPFLLFTCLTKSPVILAWEQLLIAIVAGTGMYLFCRRVLRVSFWPAALVAWCYPMTGFFILWQGLPTCLAVYWLPWLLLTVNRTIHGSKIAAIMLALVTGLTLVSGHIDVAGQTLLVSGLYALWCLWQVHGWRWWRRPAAQIVLSLIIGWGTGFLLAAPHYLPVLQCAKNGYRMMLRAAGNEERPPIGLAALPQTVLPDMYGSSLDGSIMLAPDDRTSMPETSAEAYAGILATLLVAPLAWFSQRHRAINLFLLLLAVFGLSWCLDIPGFVSLFRLPVLNMVSFNRLTFATAFAILAMSAIGLEMIRQGKIHRQKSLWIIIGLLAGFFVWCLYRSEYLPEPLATKIGNYVQTGHAYLAIKNVDDLRHFQNWFSWHYTIPTLWCGAGLMVCWLLRRSRKKFLPTAIGGLMLADLLVFGYGRNPQCSPSLYYPKISALIETANATSDRIIGYDCLPPKLGFMAGLRDVRGYDSVDPAPWVRLLMDVRDPRSPSVSYAVTQWLMPPLLKSDSPDTVRLPPVFDMMAVRYVIFRGVPPPSRHPQFQSDDYFVVKNPSGLHRAFVPQSVQVVPNEEIEIKEITAPDFDPSKTAYVETPVKLSSECRGSAKITDDNAACVVVEAQMKTPGLLVLADSWSRDWKATVNGKPAPILRTDYALRGVVLPAGKATVVFRYDSNTIRLAFFLAASAFCFVIIWFLVELSAGYWRRGEKS